jgi:hypothetical protein
MPNTTNYNWATPADTDLVKDGAAAIRTLGSSADTTVKNLNPGTTAGDIDYYTSSTAKARVAIGTAGQVLRVNSGGNAPEWATTADQTPLTTKGDLFTFDTADARLGVGANGTVLTADSTEATGLKWATAASGVATAWTLVNAGGTALTGATDVTISFSAQKELLILVDLASTANANPEIGIRPNNISTATYSSYGTYDVFPSVYAIGNFDNYQNYSGDTKILLGANSSAARGVSGYCFIDKADQTGWKRFQSVGTGDGTTANWHRYNLSGVIEMSAAITSITINSSDGNFDSGTVYILGGN